MFNWIVSCYMLVFFLTWYKRVFVGDSLRSAWVRPQHVASRGFTIYRKSHVWKLAEHIIVCVVVNAVRLLSPQAILNLHRQLMTLYTLSAHCHVHRKDVLLHKKQRPDYVCWAFNSEPFLVMVDCFIFANLIIKLLEESTVSLFL